MASEAWTKKSGKNPKGGLNEKGRKSYEKANPGSNLKPPVKKEQAKKSPKSAARRKSFCSRMEGMKKKIRLARLLKTQIVELTSPFAHGIVKPTLENR